VRAVLLAFVTAVTLTSRVTDLAGVMRPEDAAALDRELADLERTDSTQVVLVTVPSTEGAPIEDFTLNLARENGIGQKGKSNGVLVLVAVNDRRCRIEVGYGLEGKVPDTIAALIIQHEMVPHFRAGDFSGGARAGVEAVIRAVRGEYHANAPGGSGLPFNANRLGIIAVVALMTNGLMRMFRRWWWLIFLGAPGWVALAYWWASVPFQIALLVVGFATVGPFFGFLRGRSGSGWYSSSSSSGGGFSGGGGSFGGGGASGSW
jgi:uncharacterized protein